jgi:hypothetical protein
MGDFGLYLHTQRPEVVSNEGGGPELPIPELGVLVDVPPPGYDLVRDRLGSGIHFGAERFPVRPLG